MRVPPDCVPNMTRCHYAQLLSDRSLMIGWICVSQSETAMQASSVLGSGSAGNFHQVRSPGAKAFLWSPLGEEGPGIEPKPPIPVPEAPPPDPEPPPPELANNPAPRPMPRTESEIGPDPVNEPIGPTNPAEPELSPEDPNPTEPQKSLGPTSGTVAAVHSADLAIGFLALSSKLASLPLQVEPSKVTLGEPNTGVGVLGGVPEGTLVPLGVCGLGQRWGGIR